MEGRLSITDALLTRRDEISEEIRFVAPSMRNGQSPMMVRSLVAAIGRAIDDTSPEPVLVWLQTVRPQLDVPTILSLIERACERITAMSETLHVDYSSLVVFLEIVKSTSIDALTTTGRAAGNLRAEPHSEVVLGALAMLKARDEATCAHSQATGAWCRRLSAALNLPTSTTELIVQAGVLHDIGKIATPDAILFKANPLSDLEWVTMRKHAAHGADILRAIPSLAHCAYIVRAHHERYDGLGYPDGLKGEEIPFEARVIAVADSFHAMISARPYRAALGQREAIEILRAGSGTQWDPTVVYAMIEMLDTARAKPDVLIASSR